VKQQVFPIIFLGTDDLSLKGLDQLIQHPSLQVKGVITQAARPGGRGMQPHPSPVAQRAEQLSLPVLTPDNLKSPEFLSEVKNWKAQWAIVLSYGKILPDDFFFLFPD